MDAGLDTLATALYVTTDDFLIDNPQHRPWRPKVGITPRLEDAELVTLVALQALLGSPQRRDGWETRKAVASQERCKSD